MISAILRIFCGIGVLPIPLFDTIGAGYRVYFVYFVVWDYRRYPCLMLLDADTECILVYFVVWEYRRYPCLTPLEADTECIFAYLRPEMPFLLLSGSSPQKGDI